VDVHGPVSVQSHSEQKYYAIFIDDCTKYKVNIPIKKKSDTFTAFLRFQTYAKNQLKDTMKAIQDDKGGKFISKEFDAHCDKKGIICRHCAPESSAEWKCRKWQQGCITSLLSEANLLMQFWAEALVTLTHV